MITIVCYNSKETWSSKANALKFYKTGMAMCDAGSHEWCRYDTIVNQLNCGFKYCADNEDVVTEQEAKAICDACDRMNPHDEKWRMAKC